MNRRELLMAIPMLALAGGASAQQKPLVLPAKWYLVQIEDGAFRAEMPGIPDHRIVNDVSARGTAFALHSYSLEEGGYSYVVQTALFPGDVDISQPRRLIQVALDERAKVLEARKWSKVDWRDIAGSPAAAPMKASDAKRRPFNSTSWRNALPPFSGPVESAAALPAVSRHSTLLHFRVSRTLARSSSAAWISRRGWATSTSPG